MNLISKTEEILREVLQKNNFDISNIVLQFFNEYQKEVKKHFLNMQYY